MGYYITYKLTKEELDSQFIPLYKKINDLNNEISNIKLELKLYTLIHSEDTIASIIKEVNLKIRQYIFLLKDLAKHYIYDAIDTEGEVTFCGWQYSQDPEYDENYIINNMTDNLCVQKLIVPTGDYFSDDELFSRKCEEIASILDYEEIILEMIYSKFKEKYYEKSDEYQIKLKELEENGN